MPEGGLIPRFGSHSDPVNIASP